MSKNTEIKNPKVVRTKNGKVMLSSKYALCNSKKLKFLKEQVARGLLINLTGRKITNSNSFTHIKYFTLKV